MRTGRLTLYLQVDLPFTYRQTYPLLIGKLTFTYKYTYPLLIRYLSFPLPSLSLRFLPFPFTPFSFPFTYKHTHPILISIPTFSPICAAAPLSFPFSFSFYFPFPLYISIPTFYLPFPFPLLISIYTYLPVSPSRFILFSLSFRRFHRLKSSGKQKCIETVSSKNGVGLRPAPKFFSFSLYI